MDIKVGFTENPRELVIAAADNREEVLSKISEAIQGEKGILELTDSKGHTFFVNVEEIAYVEVGSANRPAVGFGGA
jgi:hypothetical protein